MGVYAARLGMRRLADRTRILTEFGRWYLKGSIPIPQSSVLLPPPKP